MRVGDLLCFNSLQARHQNANGVECGSREFAMTFVGAGGAYGGYGECVSCHGEVRVFTDGIVALNSSSLQRSDYAAKPTEHR